MARSNWPNTWTGPPPGPESGRNVAKQQIRESIIEESPWHCNVLTRTTGSIWEHEKRGGLTTLHGLVAEQVDCRSGRPWIRAGHGATVGQHHTGNHGGSQWDSFHSSDFVFCDQNCSLRTEKNEGFFCVRRMLHRGRRALLVLLPDPLGVRWTFQLLQSLQVSWGCGHTLKHCVVLSHRAVVSPHWLSVWLLLREQQ